MKFCDICFQELFAAGGVDMVIEYLKKDPAKVHSPLGDHALFLAAVDCIWYDPHIYTCSYLEI